jgi:hypothetical protein
MAIYMPNDPLVLPESTGQEEVTSSIVAPNSPLSTPKPAATATKVAYPVPEVVSIPPQNVTTVDTLASGLKLEDPSHSVSVMGWVQ